MVITISGTHNTTNAEFHTAGTSADSVVAGTSLDDVVLIRNQHDYYTIAGEEIAWSNGRPNALGEFAADESTGAGGFLLRNPRVTLIVSDANNDINDLGDVEFASMRFSDTFVSDLFNLSEGESTTLSIDGEAYVTVTHAVPQGGSVPEPAALGIWTLLVVTGACLSRRRRKQIVP